MELECLYTMGNAPMRLQLLAWERSLRAVGCDLPVRVLPYDRNLFDLPKGMKWYRTEFHDWLDTEGAHPMCSKYYCLTQANSFFIDADVIFLRNPQEIALGLSDFTVADTEPTKPKWTYTRETEAILSQRSSLWLTRVFNAGHFIVGPALYTEEELRRTIKEPGNERSCLHVTDQTGINLLVALAGVIPQNLNHAQSLMESTWAGDYPGEYAHLWSEPERTPYFLHWAGGLLDQRYPINRLFEEYLTEAEKVEWRTERAARNERRRQAGRWPLGVRIFNAAVRALFPNYYVQQRPPLAP